MKLWKIVLLVLVCSSVVSGLVTAINISNFASKYSEQMKQMNTVQHEINVDMRNLTALQHKE